ncbi:hypothetical protein J0X19_04080 [Hymenobacter sp. BT186]|uniref:EF-hand domain-containing protein n=1 Tax=Hymenobacter telluris TaxID=2816474 RepID=A0A939J7V5_9BACT|nr:hypothetical protein [Hymenobacter telluris]MBO0357114.1 hypothetical protein [Hymenobacter telluris]MBW3373141.1 hypothetical protein [Hymenobacter norwichensis]
MKYSTLPRLLVATALLATPALTSCNTGNKSGDTNVEQDAAKDNDADAMQPTGTGGDEATSGMNNDTSTAPSNREVYEGAADRVDRNNDGMTDK